MHRINDDNKKRKFSDDDELIQLSPQSDEAFDKLLVPAKKSPDVVIMDSTFQENRKNEIHTAKVNNKELVIRPSFEQEVPKLWEYTKKRVVLAFSG
jgi:hypothetical protein